MTTLSFDSSMIGEPRVFMIAESNDDSHRLRMVLHRERLNVHMVEGTNNVTAGMDTFKPDLVLYCQKEEVNECLDFLIKTRSAGATFPILFLLKDSASAENATGLTTGGDEIISAPYSFEEVCAKIRMLLKTSTNSGSTHKIRVGDLTIDEQSREAFLSGSILPLNKKEFDLLRYLMRSPNQVFSRQQILDNVWSLDRRRKLSVVELYISYLRRKIGKSHTVIRTVRGAGYSLKE